MKMERAHMKIDFYYWGNICPITDEMIELFNKYNDNFFVELHDISDEKGVFPNGDLDFFKRNGYIDEKVIFEDAYCKLHLLWKKLVK